MKKDLAELKESHGTQGSCNDEKSLGHLPRTRTSLPVERLL